jgi:ribosomal 50S subunit-associated protein YjgA (DUF615 family)
MTDYSFMHFDDMMTKITEDEEALEKVLHTLPDALAQEIRQLV